MDWLGMIFNEPVKTKKWAGLKGPTLLWDKTNGFGISKPIWNLQNPRFRVGESYSPWITMFFFEMEPTPGWSVCVDYEKIFQELRHLLSSWCNSTWICWMFWEKISSSQGLPGAFYSFALPHHTVRYSICGVSMGPKSGEKTGWSLAEKWSWLIHNLPSKSLTFRQTWFIVGNLSSFPVTE